MSDAVSRRYAQALIELAAEAQVVDQVGADLDQFVTVFQGDEGRLATALASPVFTVEERRRVLDQVLARLSVSPIAANLLRLVNDKRRMALVPAIANAYRDGADRLHGRLNVVVETAEPMSPELEQEVRASLEKMTGKKVTLRPQVRPELLGGLVARIGDTVYDSSIRTRLENLRRSLLQSSIAQA